MLIFVSIHGHICVKVNICIFVRDEWISEKQLPIKYAGISSCFRQEVRLLNKTTLSQFLRFFSLCPPLAMILTTLFSQFASRWAVMVGTLGASSGCISLKRSVVVGAVKPLLISALCAMKTPFNFVRTVEPAQLLILILFPRLNSLSSAPPTTMKAGSWWTRWLGTLRASARCWTSHTGEREKMCEHPIIHRHRQGRKCL